MTKLILFVTVLIAGSANAQTTNASFSFVSIFVITPCTRDAANNFTCTTPPVALPPPTVTVALTCGPDAQGGTDCNGDWTTSVTQDGNTFSAQVTVEQLTDSNGTVTTVLGAWTSDPDGRANASLNMLPVNPNLTDAGAFLGPSWPTTVTSTTFYLPALVINPGPSPSPASTIENLRKLAQRRMMLRRK